MSHPNAMLKTLFKPNPLALALSIALLSGCSVGPAYKRPDVSTPATFKETVIDGRVWKTATPGDHLPRGPWWEKFGDPQLNTLTAQVEVANESLKNTIAKYNQAAALVSSARANLFPTLNLNAGTTRAQNAVSGINQPVPTTTDSVSLSVSAWELDLWGRIRNTVDANQASAQASVADIENLKLSLQAQLVTSYLSLRVADEQIKLLNRTVDDYQKAMELTQNRYKAGVAARSDVSQAEAQLKSTQAQALDATISRQQLEHAIAVLIGKPPSELTIVPQTMTARAPMVPITTPSELLERRPDVAAAERRIAAANAQVGAAQAALFPSLNLSATAGYRQNAWAGILSLPNRFWSVGPSLAFTLFDFGAKRAQIAQSEAVYDQNVANYRQTVLTAFQDVEDNLVAIRVLEEEAVVQADAVRAANESLDHVVAQYKAGIVSYLNVITAQTTAFSNRRTELDLQNRRFSATVGLIKALGGGFAQGEMTAPAVPAPRELQLKRADNLNIFR
jgi:NodT family efflux transporter outer membrane factor (OMF) lipoprotein